MKCMDFYKIPLALGIFLSLFLGESLAQQKSGDNDWHMMGPNMMGRWGLGGFGGFLMFIFWIIIIIGAVYLTKLLMQNTQNKGDSSDRGRSGNQQPSDILKERYAKGEIDKKEFEKKKRNLL